MNQAPSAWICGDLHLENFGTYKGDNGLSYFDLNDFDEAVLAPATWEIARFLTSLWLAGEQIGFSQDQAMALEQTFLEAYRGAILDGKARWVERSIANGMIRDLLENLQSRKAFLNSRTEIDQSKERRIKMMPEKTLPLTDEQRRNVEQFFRRFAQIKDRPEQFRLLDVARRIAGTGSLGIPRYVALVAGKGTPNGHFLIDIKQTGPSSLAPYVSVRQPPWESQADRVVTIQQHVQAISPALLQPVSFADRGWVLRELQPSKDRLVLAAWNGKLDRLQKVVKTMGEVVAWGQLRSAGRQGAATIDDLIEFVHHEPWTDELVIYAQQYSETVRANWIQFRDAWRGQS